MSELPKIAQDRLIKSYPGPHPEADLLAAFTEQSLSAGERERVLAHLAACADCREVVHLGLPPLEESQQVFAGSPQSKMFGWSRMRWGALAAGMAAVFTVAVLIQREGPQQLSANKSIDDRVALSEADRALPKPDAKPADKTAAAKTGNERLKSGGGSDTFADAVRPIQAGNKAPAPAATAQIAASKPDQQAKQKINLDQYNYGYAPMPQQAGPVAQTNAPAQSQVQSKDQTQNANGPGRVQTDALPSASGGSAKLAEAIPPAAPAPPVSGRSVETDLKKEAARKDDRAEVRSEPLNLMAVPEKQKALAAGRASSFTLPAEAKSASAQTPARSLDGSLWRINQGALQLMGATVQPQAAPAADEEKSKTRVSVTGNIADAWRQVKTARDVPLNAIAVFGKDIWVGGANGSLQHSPDNGKTWAEVRGPWPPDATIISLRFRDRTRGEMRTSAGERWTTEDGGSTWQIQH